MVKTTTENAKKSIPSEAVLSAIFTTDKGTDKENSPKLKQC
jgi:hypothetical protein